MAEGKGSEVGDALGSTFTAGVCVGVGDGDGTGRVAEGSGVSVGEVTGRVAGSVAAGEAQAEIRIQNTWRTTQMVPYKHFCVENLPGCTASQFTISGWKDW